MGLGKFQRQISQEDRFLNFDNYIKQQSNQPLRTAQISNDEKYLAIGRHKKIQIYYLKNKKIIKFIIGQQWIQIIKFSNNSRYLLFGDNLGYLYCSDINNNFKIIYKQSVHSKHLTGILTIDDDQILTCSDDRSLIITDIKNNQQLLKIKNAHFSWINGIDFDKSTDFIISCAADTNINFFDRKEGKCKIQQKNAHKTPILVIQLIQKDKNLISSDEIKLILWQIDYKRLQLNKLKEVNNYSYNLMSVIKNNKIVVICDKTVQILDKDLVVLQSIKHNIDIDYYLKNRQLNSLNYIIIPGADNLNVLKKVRKLQQ